MGLSKFLLLLSVFFISSSVLTFQSYGDDRSLYYYDDPSLIDLSKKGSPLVFFSTGWSGSAMGKMNKPKNVVKAARGFSIAYSLALKMYRLGIQGKVFYLTTSLVHESQRRYLFSLHRMASEKNTPSAQSSLDGNSKNLEFREFEKNYFEQVPFTTADLEPNLPAHDQRRYFWLLHGENAPVMMNLIGKVQRMKAQGAYFAGMEYHFGGPFFQAFKTALGLSQMQLLGSEIYDALGDEDPEAGPEAKTDPQPEQQSGHYNWEPVTHPAEFSQIVTYDSKIPKDLGTKGQCRRLYRDIGVPHARGSYYPVRDVETLVSEIYNFFKENRDVSNIVVKLERSSAGDGNRTYKFKDIFNAHPTFWEDEALAHRVITEELVKQFSEAYIRRMHDYGAVFEAFIQGERFKSPAVLGMIMPDKVEVYFDYNQLLGGASGQTYLGSLGPASNQHMEDFDEKNGINEADLLEPSKRILEGLKDCGAMGAVGIDFVTCDEVNAKGEKERKCYAIENNVRHTGTMYPYRTFFFLAGREVMENRYFTSTNSVKVKELPARYKDSVRKWFYEIFLENSPFKYNPDTQTGCLVYMDTWALKEVGIACVAKTEKDLLKTFKGFSESITNEVASYIEGLE